MLITLEGMVKFSGNLESVEQFLFPKNTTATLQQISLWIDEYNFSDAAEAAKKLLENTKAVLNG